MKRNINSTELNRNQETKCIDGRPIATLIFSDERARAKTRGDSIEKELFAARRSGIPMTLKEAADIVDGRLQGKETSVV